MADEVDLASVSDESLQVECHERGLTLYAPFQDWCEHDAADIFRRLTDSRDTLAEFAEVMLRNRAPHEMVDAFEKWMAMQ